MKDLKGLIMATLMMAIFTNAFSQENTWEPQINITGYVGTEFNYFKDIKGYERDYALALAEAGILANYQPTSKLNITGVLVYRPKLSFEQMLNELNAQYQINGFLNVKAGRFLTPLSPMNTYYYAPVNTSATLPMIVTNHEFFPLNMDALSLNGDFGDNFKIDYNLFAGGFRNSLWQGSGAMGFFSKENEYFTGLMNPAGDEPGYDMESNPNESMQFGSGAYLGLNMNNIVSVGFGMFNSNESISTTMKFARFQEIPGVYMGDHYIRTSTTTESVKKASYGTNLKLNLSTFRLIGEYWQTKAELNYFGMDMELKFQGAFVEASNTFFLNNSGILAPYVRYEYHEVPGMWTEKGQDYYRYTGGLNYKPSFETTFKLEYVYYKYEKLDLGGLVATAIFSF